MLYIVLGNLIVFFFDQFSGYTFSAMLMFSAERILHGEVWRLVTFLFVPFQDNLIYLALELYFSYFIGSTLEREWGATKFTLFYLVGVLANILVGFVAGISTMSYVNLSMFFAFATLYPNTQFLLFFLIPVKAKWLAWLDAALFLLNMIQSAAAGQYLLMLLPVAAVANYLLFFWGDLWGYVSRNFRRTKHRHSKQTVDFKAAQKKAKETKGYLHKCAVCGKTDTDNPGTEFRYCSKCDGYYCYCMEHINSHVHVHSD